MRVRGWWAVLPWLLVSGCPEDREPAATTDASTGAATTTGSATAGSSGSSEGGAEGSTGPAWPLPTEDDLLTCVRTCEGPWNCCPPGTEGQCPGVDYPYDYTCVDGLCVFPACTADTDCLGDGEVCTLVRGTPSCVVPCDGDDAPCMAIDDDQTCSGMADDGSSYCFAHCQNPGVFCGNASCDEASGVCVCSSAGQCLADHDCV